MRTSSVCVLAIVLSSAAGAQQPKQRAAADSTFSIRGVVVNPDGAALPGAEVITATGERVISNASGEFVLSNLTDRSVNLFVRRIGYVPVSFGVNVEPDVTGISIRARLDPVTVTLGTVVVEGRAMDKDLWEKGFYTRMNGPYEGTFFSPERLANSAASISTLMSEVPRVRLSVGKGGVAVPMGPVMGTGYCPLSVMIDGVAFSSSLVAEIGIDNLINISEVKAIEVYLEAGRIPTNFSGRAGTQSIANGMSVSAAGGGAAGVGFGGTGGVECGTIVVWTKTG